VICGTLLVVSCSHVSSPVPFSHSLVMDMNSEARPCAVARLSVRLVLVGSFGGLDLIPSVYARPAEGGY